MCDAITKSGSQCSRGYRWTIPNILSGTGVGRNDWTYGREIHLCHQHAIPFVDHGIPIKLINDGFLQHYNKYKYGSIVLEKIIDWNTINYSDKQFVPEYWSQGTHGVQKIETAIRS